MEDIALNMLGEQGSSVGQRAIPPEKSSDHTMLVIFTFRGVEIEKKIFPMDK